MQTILSRAPKARLRILGLLALLASPLLASPPVTVSTSKSIITFGQPVTLTATVVGVNTTGTVLFFTGTTPLGYATLASASGSFSTQSLPAGVNQIRAEYNGGFSNPVTVTVNAVRATGLMAQPILSGYYSSFSGTVADVNNDGYLDVLIADDDLEAVGVSLGGLGGQFSSPVFFGAGHDIWNIVAVDFNKDGKPDLAAMGDDGKVNILIGNGDGTFQGLVPYSVSSEDQTADVVAADLNNDGNVDLVATGENSVYILLGNGDGTFTSQGTPLLLGFIGNKSAIGDFNGDGFPDLATQDYDTSQTHVYFGVGDGTFTAGPIVGTPQGDYSSAGVAVADFNNDGFMDIASGANLTGIALGDGAGNFTELATVGTADILSIAVGDFNGDGNLDLVIGDAYDDAPDIFYGDGSGAFPNVYYADAPIEDPYLYPYYVVVGDFNGDGRADVLAPGDDEFAAVYLGTGPSSFTLSVTHSGNFTQGQNGAQFAITATNVEAGEPYSGSPTTLSNALSPGLSATAISGTGWTCTLQTLTCTRADNLSFNDSFPPVVITVNVAADAPRSLTESALFTPRPPLIGNLTPVSASDTVTSPLAIPLPSQTITFGTLADSVLGGAPLTIGATSTSGLPVTFATSGPCTVQGATVIPQSVGTCTVIAYQSGNSAFAAATPVSQSFQIVPPVVTLETSPSATATFGQPVTVIAHINAPTATGLVAFYDATTLLGYGQWSGGTATFTTSLLPAKTLSLFAVYVFHTAVDGNDYFFNDTAVELTVRSVFSNDLPVQPILGGFYTATNVFTADLNNDGFTDLIAFDDQTVASISLGAAGGAFGTPVAVNIGSAREMTVGDFNRDGKPDLLVVNSGTLSVLLGNGDGTFQSPTYVADVDSDSLAIETVDLDQDGNLDVVVTGYYVVDFVFGRGDGTSSYNYSLGIEDEIKAIRFGDFDDDGYPDFVVQSSSAADTYLALSSTNFNIETLSAPVNGPAGVVVGDFNNDGEDDVALGGDGSTQIYLGNGDGTFAIGQVVVAPNTRTVETGDFNGDGNLDLVFANSSTRMLDVYLGDGTGNFAFAYSGGPSSDSGADAMSLAVGEFNKDGRTDVAAAGSTSSLQLYFGAVNGPDLRLAKTHTGNFVFGQTGAHYSLVVTNAGNEAPLGDITVTDTIPVGLTPTAVSGAGWTCLALPAVSCTRSDALAPAAGYPVITVTVTVAGDAPSSITNTATVSGAILPDPASTANDVTIIQPAGPPQAQTIMFAVLPPRSATSASFTVAATATSGLTVTFTVLGSCTISGSTVTITGQGSCTVTANQAGDVIYSAAAPVSQTFAIISGVALSASASTSVLGQPVTLTATVSPSNATGLVLFFNGSTPLGYGTLSSGVATLTTRLLPAGVLSLSASYGAVPSNVVALTLTTFNESGLALQPPITGYEVAGNAIVADVNGDGYPDVVSTNLGTATVGVSLGSAGGQFTAPVFYPAAPDNYPLVVVDVNGDGKPDIVSPDGSAPGALYVLLGNGDGTFQPPIVSASLGAYNSSAAAGDFNGDGIVDILCTSEHGLVVYFGNGDGTFNPQSFGTIANYGEYLKVADFNQDGKTDFVFTEYGAGLRVSFGNGDGTFNAGPTLPTGSFECGEALGDFNGDGKIDVLSCGSSSTLFLNNGDGTFTAGTGLSPDMPEGINSGDFNGDGKLDVVFLKNFPKVFDVYFGDGAGGFTFGFSSPGTGVEGEFHADYFTVADLNLDGKSDIIAGGYSPEIVIYLGAGLQISAVTSGALVAGQPGSIAITVSNNASVASNGVITVVETLPAGLTATAISGDGWVCDLPSLTCTRSDVLAAAASYPPINITFAIPLDASGTLTNSFSVTSPSSGAAGSSLFAIQPASNQSQTITFNGPTSAVYGSGPFTLTATATSGLPVTFTASGNCSVSGSTLTITGAGSCTVTALQPGGSGYDAATPVIRAFGIAKANATVTLGLLTQAPATATSNPPGLTLVITYDGSTTVPTAPGTYTVVATVNNPNYQGSASGILVIGLLAQNITFLPVGNHTSDEAPITLTATSDSGLPVTFTIVSGPGTISGNTLTITGPGTIVIQASVAGNATYASATAMQTITISAGTNATLTAVVNSASFTTGVLTPGFISTAFGRNLATSTLSATTDPLPSELGGATISIVDGMGQTLTALLFFVSPTQINFLVPDDAEAGDGTLTFTSNGMTSTIPVTIGGTHPGIYAANSTGTGPAVGNVLHVTTSGTFSYTPLSTCSGTPTVCISDPIAFLTPGEHVYLAIYGTGIRGRSSLENVVVKIGDTPVAALYAGPQGQYEGLDQLNIEVPASLIGSGSTTIHVTVDGQDANPLGIVIQ